MATQTTISATGNLLIAEAYRQVEPDVIAAYPITPQTTIVEAYAKYVADGRVHTELVTVESEHSSMSACIGASAAGARTATATSSQGFAYMYEELPIAAGMRLPIVMANANRAISAPINIHADHSDVMSARDTGWIMLFAEDAQDAYDNTVMSFRIAENPAVRLPVITALDGFITTHAMERAQLMDDETVKSFAGQYVPPEALLDTENPISVGMFAEDRFYTAGHLSTRRAIDGAASIIKEIGDEWGALCGRPFNAVNAYRCEDADYVIVIIGSAAGNVRHVVNELRDQGKKVGVASIRVYRPFPYQELVQAIGHAKAIGVMDRSESFGAQNGPLGLDVHTALYGQTQAPVRDYIYGLGGFDVTLDLIRQVYADLEETESIVPDPGVIYLGIN